MADTVSFLTGDEPPQSLTVTKAALFGSGVFRGMLDIGGAGASTDGTDAEPVVLTETAVELLPFFEILEGRASELKMESWADEAWEALAKVADKCDGGEARHLIREKTWQLVAGV